MARQNIDEQSFDKDIQTQPESNSKQIDDSQLHWFWKLTTKWYFIPLFYTLIVTLQTMIYFVNKEGIDVLLHPVYLVTNTIVFMLFVPAGLIHLIFTVQGIDYKVMQSISAVFLIIFWLLFSISISKIHIYKSKHSKVLKWLIITLIIVMLLSFIGFLRGVNI